MIYPEGQCLCYDGKTSLQNTFKDPHSRCRWPPSSQANIRIGLCFRCTLHARSLHSLHCSPPQMSHLDTLKKEIPKEIPEDHQHLIGKQKESNKIILIWSGTKCRLSTHALFFLFWGFVFLLYLCDFPVWALPCALSGSLILFHCHHGDYHHRRHHLRCRNGSARLPCTAGAEEHCGTAGPVICQPRAALPHLPLLHLPLPALCRKELKRPSTMLYVKKKCRVVFGKLKMLLTHARAPVLIQTEALLTKALVRSHSVDAVLFTVRDLCQTLVNV